MDYIIKREGWSTFDPEWDEYVLKSPNGSIFHTSRWLLINNPTVEIVKIFDNKESLIGGVAFSITRRFGLKGFHVMPYTYLQGPLVGDLNSPLKKKIERKLYNVLLDQIKDINHIEIRVMSGHQDILPYHDKGFFCTLSQTYIISCTLETYLNELNANKKRELRKLQSLVDSNSITISNQVNVEEALDLLRATGKRSNYNIHEQAVENILTVSSSDYLHQIGIFHKEYGLISFGAFTYDNKRCYNILNASLRLEDPILKTINLLLIFEALKFSLDKGLVFDFEGSMVPGVAHFYELMGGKSAPVYRFQKSRSIIYSLLRFGKQLKHENSN